MIVEHRFAHIPQDARRGRAWIASLAPLAEVRLADGATVPLDAVRRYHHLGDAVLIDFRDPAQVLERPGPFVETQGLDHVVLRALASGGTIVGTPGGIAETGPGDLVVLDLARPVRIEAGPASGVAIVLPRRVLGEPADAVAVPHGQSLPGDRDPVARLVAGHLLHLAGCLPIPAEPAGHLVRATLHLCSALLAGAGGGPGDPAEVALGIAIRRHVEANLATIDVPALAARFGLSQRSLYRLFPGEGVSGFIRDRRLAHAMRLLARAPAGRPPKLARLAHDCGFTDPRVFSRAFHRKYGLWPAQACGTRPAANGEAGDPAPLAWLRDL